MSYGRNPHYIYSHCDGGICFVTEGNVTISDEAINALLYKMLLSHRRDELAERLRKGKQEWCRPMRFVEGEVYPAEAPEDDPERQATIRWMEEREDDILKRLMREVQP